MSAWSDINVPELLKTVWQDEIHDFIYEDQPLWGMIPKRTDWDGQYQDVTMKYGGVAGRSASFSAAKSNKSPGIYAKMHIATRDNFALWSVDNKFITLSRNQKGALVRALAEGTETAMKKFKRSMGWMIYRNGGGSIGKIASGGISANVITLDDPDNTRNFEKGDVIELSTSDGTSGVLKAGTAVVDIVDEDAGTVQVEGATLVLAIPAAAAADYIFIEGDFGAAVYGVEAYVTRSAPGVGGVPTTIWGMDRTQNPTKLSGNRVAAGGNQIVEAIKKLLTVQYKRKAKTTHLFMHPDNFNDLENSLGSNKRYADEKVGVVGFTGIEFTAQGSSTRVKAFSDPDCKLNDVWALNLDTWVFHSADDFPQWLTADGKKSFMTEENSNSNEGRIGGYGQAYTDAPGENGLLDLAS
jgi:hypothetical protein